MGKKNHSIRGRSMKGGKKTMGEKKSRGRRKEVNKERGRKEEG